MTDLLEGPQIVPEHGYMAIQIQRGNITRYCRVELTKGNFPMDYAGGNWIRRYVETLIPSMLASFTEKHSCKKCQLVPDKTWAAAHAERMFWRKAANTALFKI